MGGIICSACGRDLDEIGQCNMSYTREPLCEDCWHGTVAQQGHAGTAANHERAAALERLDECALLLTRCTAKEEE